MIQGPFEAYSGKEPFVFVSYAHKDTESVYSLINYLHEKGCRIWYDQGIEVGVKWTDAIASKIHISKIFITCISRNTVESPNCSRELNSAVKYGVVVLPVYINNYISLPKGFEMQLGDREYIVRTDYNSANEFYNAVRKALENCMDSTDSVFDYAHNTKPLVLGGRELPEVYLRRNTVLEELHSFITGTRLKYLLLQDVSGAGKSTILLKYIQDYYNWDVHGELVYFSFEYEPYFTKFLYTLAEKYFQEDMKDLSVDDIASRLLSHWENQRCTIIFDAIEHLFTQPDEGGEPQISDSRFLVFINDLASLKQAKIILSTKLNIGLFNKYPYMKKICLQNISMIDFLDYLKDYGLKFDEEDDWEYLKDVLTKALNNMATIQMFAMFVKEFCSKSATKARENKLVDSANDIQFKGQLFQYYWEKFNVQEQIFLKELALFRREIPLRILMQIIPDDINKIELMNKIKYYLFANKHSDPVEGETLSIHEVLKSAIVAKTSPDEQKAAHILASNAYIYEDTSHELHYLEMRTERIYHLIKGNDIDNAISLMLTVHSPLSRGFIDLVYYHSQFPICIELISMVLQTIPMDDPNYITLNRKIAMALDKNGGTLESLDYFENYIQASLKANCYRDYIKGMYYKSEPIGRLGRYVEAEQLLNKAWEEAKKYKYRDVRTRTNLLGRRALYRMKTGNVNLAERDINEALEICNAESYRFDDKSVINCWWRLIHAKIKMMQGDYQNAERLLNESLKIAQDNEYVDFEAECYMEKAVLSILTNGEAADLLEKAISLSGDNLYLLIRLRLIKVYLELLKHPKNSAIQSSIFSSRILLNGTGYEELNTLSTIILFYARAYQNCYEFDNLNLPKVPCNNTEERLTQQVQYISKQLKEIGEAISTNTKSIKELI